jgi:hypothetical protein
MQEPHQRTGLRIPRGKSVILEIAQKTRGEIETFATATGHATVPSPEPRARQGKKGLGVGRRMTTTTPIGHNYAPNRGRVREILEIRPLNSC